jgi:hypothetical protein
MTNKQLYLIWEHWKEQGGILKNRPSVLPPKIPTRWFLRYKSRHIKKPVEYNGVFSGFGVAMRTPGGNIENTDEQSKYVQWSALNVGRENTLDRWYKQIEKNSNSRITSIPWMHCRDDIDIDHLFSIAEFQRFNARKHCIINFEAEAISTLPPSHIRQRIDNYKKVNPGAEVATFVLPWVQNGQGWKALRDIPTYLEVFTNEMPQYTAAVCVDHARKEGLNLIGCLWGAYPIYDKHPDPKMYPLNNYELGAIYCGDDVQNWEDWQISKS